MRVYRQRMQSQVQSQVQSWCAAPWRYAVKCGGYALYFLLLFAMFGWAIVPLPRAQKVTPQATQEAAPDPVILQQPTLYTRNRGRRTLRLSWSTNLNSGFRCYRVYRATQQGVHSVPIW